MYRILITPPKLGAAATDHSSDQLIQADQHARKAANAELVFTDGLIGLQQEIVDAYLQTPQPVPVAKTEVRQ